MSDRYAGVRPLRVSAGRLVGVLTRPRFDAGRGCRPHVGEKPRGFPEPPSSWQGRRGRAERPNENQTPAVSRSGATKKTRRSV